MTTADTQRTGEDAAARFLQKKGFRILARNWRIRMGELDIVAMKKRLIVFVEVKTRVRDLVLLPEDSVGWQKQNRIKRLAEAFLAYGKHDFESCRFDVISVIAAPSGPQIRHIEDAF